MIRSDGGRREKWRHRRRGDGYGIEKGKDLVRYKESERNEGWSSLFFFQAEDGIRDVERSRGLGDVYKRRILFGCPA